MFNIAINTFREIIRNRFLYMILFFAGVFIIFSLFLGELTIGDEEKVIVDFGLAMIEIFGLVGVLFVGSQLLFKEIEGKTIFLILSKPIQRYEFIIGKFLGFSLSIFLIIFLQSCIFIGVIFFYGIGIDTMTIASMIFTYIKLEITLGLVFFLSTFMSNILTILVALMIYFVSHSFSLILDIAGRTENSSILLFAQGLQLLFPPFEALNIKDIIGGIIQLDFGYFISNGIYSLLYLCIILICSIIIFHRKKFDI